MYKSFIFLTLFITLIGAQNNFTGLECCANCLNTPNIIGGNDALDFDKCSLNNTGCCYESNCHMSLITNNFLFSDNIVFQNNTPYVNQGEWFQLQWINIQYITYIFINENQIKEIQPKNTSIIELSNEENWFQFCLETPGNIYLRGWTDNGCIGSIEYNILVKENLSFDSQNSICNNRPKADIENECNLNRASLIDDECICVSGYSNPPNCDKSSNWKIVTISICSTAALLTITCLLYNYYKKQINKGRGNTNHFHFDNSDSISHPNSRYNHL
jgi:hypothetical protein